MATRLLNFGGVSDSAARAKLKVTRSTARRRQLKELSESDRPLSTTELALMLGMSSTFIRSEIRQGYLRAVSIGRGRKRVFRIPAAEARAYLERLGFGSARSFEQRPLKQ